MTNIRIVMNIFKKLNNWSMLWKCFLLMKNWRYSKYYCSLPNIIEENASFQLQFNENKDVTFLSVKVHRPSAFRHDFLAKKPFKGWFI